MNHADIMQFIWSVSDRLDRTDCADELDASVLLHNSISKTVNVWRVWTRHLQVPQTQQTQQVNVCNQAGSFLGQTSMSVSGLCTGDSDSLRHAPES